MVSRKFFMRRSGPMGRDTALPAEAGRRNRHMRSSSGGAIVEAGASMALLIPVVLILIWAITQVSQYFIIKQQLAYVARQAAREIAYGYGTMKYTTMNSGGIASGAAATGDSNYQNILNDISVPSVINANSSSQFQVSFTIPNSPSLARSYVTATVTYQNGPNLPRFPWNPLQTGFLRFDTTGIVIRSSCSWPIPHS